jgi:hypothetical protein
MHNHLLLALGFGNEGATQQAMIKSTKRTDKAFEIYFYPY